MNLAYQFDAAELRPDQRRLLLNGEDSRIGARAFDLLLALIERRDRVVSKSELLDLLWPGLVVEENNLQVHISSLRKLLGPQAIATVPGRGYRFTAALNDDSFDDTRGRAAAAAPAPAAAALTNLPSTLAPLIGRDQDLPALRALTDAHQLVTVVGAGGIGKTALAQALAHHLREAFDDGVWQVEFAPIAQAALVANTVASVLRVPLGTDAPAESLARYLSGSRMLIVLDNCEHLVDGVAELAAAIHRSAPGVRLVATSQEPLRVPDEHLYRLGVLALPDQPGLAQARQAGAVALFEARAGAAQPGFTLGEHNVAAVVDICSRLDGIALAIELAAARVPLLGVEGLRAKLDERFRVLTGGSRLALRRHQTMRAALEWSHGLLTADEQTVFRRLGAFVGSFDLSSAQHVANDERIDEWAVLECLGGLVDKSLVATEGGPEPRYRLLETNRAYALERLQQGNETEPTMRRHAEAALAVFEASRREEYILPLRERLEKYLPDLDNARAALDWSAGPHGDTRLYLALAGAVGWIWEAAVMRIEGQRHRQVAIERLTDSVPPAIRARVLHWASIAHCPGPREADVARGRKAIELYRTLGDEAALHAALCTQARQCVRRGLLDEAGQSVAEAESLIQPGWSPWRRALGLRARVNWLDGLGRTDESLECTHELLRLARLSGDLNLVLGQMISLEQAQARAGELEASIAAGREMVSLLESDRFLRGTTLEQTVKPNLMMSLARSGRLDEALVFAPGLATMVRKTGLYLDYLELLALIAFERGRIADAARLLSRSDRLYAEGGFERQAVEQVLRDELVQRLQQALAPAVLAARQAEGLELEGERILELALVD
jgi:predicted ATPase/DNA-binding winged helix-turn-helix (wHTH) protein